MVTIYNITNGETYKMYQASKEYATNDSVCVPSVGNTFRRNWKNIVMYFIQCGSFQQLILEDNYRVKGVDKNEEKRYQDIFGWAW